jgi:hypothetical protein
MGSELHVVQFHVFTSILAVLPVYLDVLGNATVPTPALEEVGLAD